MSVTLLNVLNTVAPLGADAFVDASGFLNLQGTPAFKTSSIDSVTITPYAAEQLQETTVTVSTVSNNAIYSLSFVYTDANSGMIESVPLTVTSDSTATDTEICNAFRALMTANTAINSIVAVSGTTTLIVTAKAGFPIFSLSTSDAKMTIVTGTLGRTSVGTGTSLIGTYPSTAGYFNAGGFTAASSIVATNNYTQVLISSTTGGSAVILVNVAATAANVASLIGTYGTLTGLKAGYRVAFPGASVQPTGTLTIASYVATVTVTANELAAYGVQSGDYLVRGTSVAKVSGVASTTTAVTDIATVAGGSYTIAYWRSLPL
jgi:hypothetical protein